jgi:hypothetical protein
VAHDTFERASPNILGERLILHGERDAQVLLTLAELVGAHGGEVDRESEILVGGGEPRLNPRRSDPRILQGQAYTFRCG